MEERRGWVELRNILDAFSLKIIFLITAAQSLKIPYQFLILTFMQNPEGDFPMASSELTWINVLISLAFILFDIGVSTVFRLGIGLSLLIAGLRCVGQLALVATVLHEVFETKNPWLVFLICCALFLPSISMQFDSNFLSLVMLNLLGTFETGTLTWQICLSSWPPSTVINRSSRRFRYMVRQLFYRKKCMSYFDSGKSILSYPILKFPAVLMAMLGSTIPISIIGTKFAMSVTPFWAPIRFSKVNS